MGQVYVIHGYTGEYSDRGEWIVAAYLDRAEAEKHLKALEDFCIRNHVLGMRSRDSRDRDLIRDELRANLDPLADIDYTGVDYDLSEIEIREKAP